MLQILKAAEILPFVPSGKNNLSISGPSSFEDRCRQTGSTISQVKTYNRYHQNLLFSTMASSKRVSTGDSNDDRQPEIAAETGNTHL